MQTLRHYDDPTAHPTAKNGEVTEYPAEENSYDYLGKSASATDCTGLITHGPVNQAALESYQQVYSFLPPEPVPKSDSED